LYKLQAPQNLDLPPLRDQGAGLHEVSHRFHVVGLGEFLLRYQGVYLRNLTQRHGVNQLNKVWKRFFTPLMERHCRGEGGGGVRSRNMEYKT
jgi:diphthamide synthase (EF-2-diphthine--ammonia ligase)